MSEITPTNSTPLNISGIVLNILPIQSGTSKAGNQWQKQDFILETGGQYTVLHVEDGDKTIKGRYPTIDLAKEGVIFHREARLELLVRYLSDELERSRKKPPIK